ncbi:MAG: hypothetical protein HY674_00720 [Chloroflexi bacterium]|nr:hypothetical protein [Chloroflexota bacterium]
MKIVRLTGVPGFPPGFLREPVNQSVALGAEVRFQAAAAGTEPLRYQWRKVDQDLADNQRISGATMAELMIRPVERADLGQYSAVVSNAAGTVESRQAKLLLSEAVYLRAGLVNGRVSLTLHASEGRRFQIQYTDQLTPPITWTELTTVTVLATPVILEDNQSPTAPQCFYRAVAR